MYNIQIVISSHTEYVCIINFHISSYTEYVCITNCHISFYTEYVCITELTAALIFTTNNLLNNEKFLYENKYHTR